MSKAKFFYIWGGDTLHFFFKGSEVSPQFKNWDPAESSGYVIAEFCLLHIIFGSLFRGNILGILPVASSPTYIFLVLLFLVVKVSVYFSKRDYTLDQPASIVDILGAICCALMWLYLYLSPNIPLQY